MAQRSIPRGLYVSNKNNKKIFIIGNGKEFLLRGIYGLLAKEGYVISFSDTSLDTVYPVPQDTNLCLLFADGMTLPKQAIPLKEVCALSQIPVCIVGDKIGIESARDAFPAENICMIIKRPVGAQEIAESLKLFFKDNTQDAYKTTPEIALLTKDKAFAEGFTRLFSEQYLIHHADSMGSIQAVVQHKGITMVAADCDILAENDYSLYNNLCKMPAFQKLPLIIITQNSQVVNIAKAEIMNPTAVFDKTMSISKITQILKSTAVRNYSYSGGDL